MEREKLIKEEALNRSMEDRASLERSVQRLEEENSDIRRQLHSLQAQIAQLEQDNVQS
jgi:septal ring factor EnvC (AmiA/AmiB activator)